MTTQTKEQESGIRTAKFFVAKGNMTTETIVKYFEYVIKRAKINRNRTIYLNTKAKHSSEILKMESALEYMKEVQN